jgi:drug/metabolite transporter (DMT)-like permease
MIPKECKRLAEVDFPIAVVSKHSAREKSIRHGHPSTLHLWWARRPQGAARIAAVIASLPADAYGLERSAAWLVALISSLGPSVTLIFGMVVLGERLRRTQWAGLVLVFTSLVLISLP